MRTLAGGVGGLGLGAALTLVLKGLVADLTGLLAGFFVAFLALSVLPRRKERAKRLLSQGLEEAYAAVRRALEEARRLGAGEKEVAQLEERLRKAAQEARRRDLLLEEEKGRFRVALEKVVALLSLLPTPQGETPWPRVPEPGQEEEGLLTLRLAPGPVALGPLTLTLSHAGGTWYLGLEGEDHPLEDTLVLPWEDLEVWEALLERLPSQDPRRPIARARVARLRGEWGLRAPAPEAGSRGRSTGEGPQSPQEVKEKPQEPHA